MHRHRPEPKYSFTIPSVHDDTKLECRIYHPWSFDGMRGSGAEAAGRDGCERGGVTTVDSAVEDSGELGVDVGEGNADAHASSDSRGGSLATRCRKKGIVVAHPYAPLGGSYDDRVVGMVVEEFVRLGWVVGTFCFRGAHDSHGRTSWSGKPEVRDYISFAGCFMLYLLFLDPDSFSPIHHPALPQTPSRSTNSEFPTIPPTTTDDNSTVILAGYSHGSLILQHLPPVPEILQQFSTPLEGSAASEITLRAARLAAETNAEWKASTLATQEEERGRKSKAKPRTHDRNKLSVTMGGEETAAELRRSSREIRRSMEGRRSLELGRLGLGRRAGVTRHARKSTEGDLGGGKEDEREVPVAVDKHPSPSSPPSTTTTPIPIPSHIAYLLISPITPPLSYLLTPGLHSFWPRRDAGSHDQLLMQHHTLIVFGDQDVFSSARRIRAWVERMREGGGKVEGVEVKGAGHFWVEDGVEARLRERIRRWGMGMGCV